MKQEALKMKCVQKRLTKEKEEIFTATTNTKINMCEPFIADASGEYKSCAVRYIT